MKNKKNRRKNSIGNRIRYILFGTVLAAGIIFSFLFYLQNDVFSKYNEYMNLNSKLGALSDELDSSEQSSTSYMNGEITNSAQGYMNSNIQLNSTLHEIKPYMQEYVNSSIYFRTLSNMIDDYETRANALITKKMIDDYETRANALITKTSSDADSYHEWMDLNVLMTYINTQQSKLTVTYLNYSSKKYSDTLKVYKSTVLKIYILITLLLCIGSAYAASMSRNTVSIMKRLCRYAQELSNAHWEIPDIEAQKFYELDKLADTFNKMKIKIRDSIDKLNHESEIESQYNKEKLRNAENDQLLKEAQLTVLQSQMNPHFLFNTLNMISRTAMFENADDTVKLVEATSKILRYNLDCKSKLVDLREELSMVHFYIMIQKTRFQEQMAFYFKVDDGIDDIKIPPMTIQPIVENAIIHGLKEKDHGGVITISAEKKNDFFAISVEDNGIGISQEDIDGILNHTKTSSLGIYNIKKRLEINFGRSNLLKIDSTVGLGTRFTILIPIENTDAADSELLPAEGMTS